MLCEGVEGVCEEGGVSLHGKVLVSSTLHSFAGISLRLATYLPVFFLLCFCSLDIIRLLTAVHPIIMYSLLRL